MRILILGSTGFVGRNLCDSLSPFFTVLKTARSPVDSSFIYFDLTNRDSWRAVVQLNPDVVINAAAYGVIKHEIDLKVMYEVNYLLITEFYNFLRDNKSDAFWFQIGTAFEYDLSINGGITEQTSCLPRTHYGISKLMVSRFLLERADPGSFSIIRPFGMFGKYEDESKFFPMLITAQLSKQPVKLSAGTQQRDYFFIDDLGEFIRSIITNNKWNDMPAIVNLGAGEAKSLKAYGSVLSTVFQVYDPGLWQWEAVDFRANESSLFFNSSSLASHLGFKLRELKEGFSETAKFYQNEL
jgi:nucleoside-diphosphate-sugar epimerase